MEFSRLTVAHRAHQFCAGGHHGNLVTDIYRSFPGAVGEALIAEGLSRETVRLSAHDKAFARRKAGDEPKQDLKGIIQAEHLTSFGR